MNVEVVMSAGQLYREVNQALDTNISRSTFWRYRRELNLPEGAYETQHAVALTAYARFRVAKCSINDALKRSKEFLISRGL